MISKFNMMRLLRLQHSFGNNSSIVKMGALKRTKAFDNILTRKYNSKACSQRRHFSNQNKSIFSSSNNGSSNSSTRLMVGGATIALLSSGLMYFNNQSNRKEESEYVNLATNAISPATQIDAMVETPSPASETGESKFSIMDTHVKLFAGTGNPELAEEIAKKLGTRLSDVTAGKFLDGEISIRIGESVRGCDCYIIQPTCAPTNDNLMELLLMVSAFRRASAKTITAVMPYYGYKLEVGGQSMQRKKNNESTSAIASADIAEMLVTMGVDRIVTVDLQPPGQGEIEGFFANRAPVDCIEATYAGVEYFRPIVSKDAVIVSANPTCTKKTRDFQSGLLGSGYRWKDGKLEKMDVSVALFIPETKDDDGDTQGNVGMVDVLYPHRLRSDDSVSGVEDGDKPTLLKTNLGLVGSVKGKDVVIVDDLIDTGRSLIQRAEYLKAAGAKRIFAFATHGVFSENAYARLNGAKVLDQIVVTNTIPDLRTDEEKWTAIKNNIDNRIVRVSISGVVAECIRRIHDRESLKKYTAYQAQNTENRYAAQGNE
jgi:ribose-phosphate pyrophosphokinase